MTATSRSTNARSAERREIRKELEEQRKEWRKVRTTLHVTEPKSARNRRTIKLPAVVASALKTHRTAQLEERLAAGKHWEDSGLVFTSPIGTAMELRNVSRELKGMPAVANIPHVRFHDLRHTAAA